MTKDIMYKALYQKQINGNLMYYWQDPIKHGVKMISPGTELTVEQQTAIASEEFEDEFIDLEKRQVGEYMVVHHPDQEDAHDDHPDSTALMNFAYDSYNNSSGIKQFYADKVESERAASNAAIAEANRGASD